MSHLSEVRPHPAAQHVQRAFDLLEQAIAELNAAAVNPPTMEQQRQFEISRTYAETALRWLWGER